MEWMLQVVDEVDDTLWAVLHACVGPVIAAGAVLTGIGDAMRLRVMPMRARP